MSSRPEPVPGDVVLEERTIFLPGLTAVAVTYHWRPGRGRKVAAGALAWYHPGEGEQARERARLRARRRARQRLLRLLG